MTKPARNTNRQVEVRKLKRVLDYMKRIDLDPNDALRSTTLTLAQIEKLDDADLLPATEYSRLYSAAVKQMQSLNRPIPWAAGIGSDAFELMCHAIISCRTLGEALKRAERYDHLCYPLLGYKMRLLIEDQQFKLRYHVRTQSSEDVFAPNRWDWAEHFDSVAHVSGLVVWYKFCAWLIGENFELNSAHVSAPYVSEAYEKGAQQSLGCDISFNALESCLRGPIECLDLRVVHSPESLERFLDNSVYELIATADERRSTTAAIRSLISRDFNAGLPSFQEMASFLHCSPSSLRRRLQRENTSYQEIKDQLRCEFAIDHLRNRNTRIDELAELLGFAEPSSFVRSFRSWVGMTPSAYRDELPGHNSAGSVVH